MADAMAAGLRNIRRPAEREPGAADVEAFRQRLLRGEIAKIAEHHIVHESSTESRAEFIGHGGPELAEAHPLSVSGSQPPDTEMPGSCEPGIHRAIRAHRRRIDKC